MFSLSLETLERGQEHDTRTQREGIGSNLFNLPPSSLFPKRGGMRKKYKREVRILDGGLSSFFLSYHSHTPVCTVSIQSTYPFKHLTHLVVSPANRNHHHPTAITYSCLHTKVIPNLSSSNINIPNAIILLSTIYQTTQSQFIVSIKPSKWPLTLTLSPPPSP